MTSEDPQHPGRWPDEAAPGAAGPAPYGNPAAHEDDRFPPQDSGAQPADFGWAPPPPPPTSRPSAPAARNEPAGGSAGQSGPAWGTPGEAPGVSRARPEVQWGAAPEASAGAPPSGSGYPPEWAGSPGQPGPPRWSGAGQPRDPSSGPPAYPAQSVSPGTPQGYPDQSFGSAAYPPVAPGTPAYPPVAPGNPAQPGPTPDNAGYPPANQAVMAQSEPWPASEAWGSAPSRAESAAPPDDYPQRSPDRPQPPADPETAQGGAAQGSAWAPQSPTWSAGAADARPGPFEPSRPEFDRREPDGPAYQPAPTPGMSAENVVPLPPQETRIPGASLAASLPTDYGPPAGLQPPVEYAPPGREPVGWASEVPVAAPQSPAPSAAPVVPQPRIPTDSAIAGRVSVPGAAGRPELGAEPDRAGGRVASGSAAVPAASRVLPPVDHAAAAALPAPQPRMYGRPAAPDEPDRSGPAGAGDWEPGHPGDADARPIGMDARRPEPGVYGAPPAQPGPEDHGFPDDPPSPRVAMPGSRTPAGDAPNRPPGPGGAPFADLLGPPNGMPGNPPGGVEVDGPGPADPGRFGAPTPSGADRFGWPPPGQPDFGPPMPAAAASPGYGIAGPAGGMPGPAGSAPTAYGATGSALTTYGAPGAGPGTYGAPGTAPPYGSPAPTGPWGASEGADQDGFDSFTPKPAPEPKPEANPEAPTPQVRNGKVLFLVLVAAVLLLAIPLGTLWLLGKIGGENASPPFNPAVGACVKDSGGTPVIADCAEQGVFKVASKVTDKAECPVDTPQTIVIPERKEVLCLQPATASIGG